MMTNANSTQNVANQLPAANGLAIVRLTVGAMLVWVFFENLGKAASPRYSLITRRWSARIRIVGGRSARRRSPELTCPALGS